MPIYNICVLVFFCLSGWLADDRDTFTSTAVYIKKEGGYNHFIIIINMIFSSYFFLFFVPACIVLGIVRLYLSTYIYIWLFGKFTYFLLLANNNKCFYIFYIYSRMTAYSRRAGGMYLS